MREDAGRAKRAVRFEHRSDHPKGTPPRRAAARARWISLANCTAPDAGSSKQIGSVGELCPNCAQLRLTPAHMNPGPASGRIRAASTSGLGGGIIPPTSVYWMGRAGACASRQEDGE